MKTTEETDNFTYPVFVGMIRLPLVKILKKEDGLIEMVREIAVDSTGALWGLVVKQRTIENRVARLTMDRWIRVSGITVNPYERLHLEED